MNVLLDCSLTRDADLSEDVVYVLVHFTIFLMLTASMLPNSILRTVPIIIGNFSRLQPQLEIKSCMNIPVLIDRHNLPLVIS